MSTKTYKARHLWGVRPGDSPYDADLDSATVAFIETPLDLYGASSGRKHKNPSYEPARQAVIELTTKRQIWLDGFEAGKRCAP